MLTKDRSVPPILGLFRTTFFCFSVLMLVCVQVSAADRAVGGEANTPTLEAGPRASSPGSSTASTASPSASSLNSPEWRPEISVAQGSAVLNIDSEQSFASLQGAIDAADPGDTLEVQASILNTPQVMIDKDLTLAGATGSEAVIMTVDTGDSGDSRAWFLVQPGVDLTVRDITFDGDDHLVHQAFRHLGSGSFDNVHFNDIQYNASGPQYAGTAIVAFGGKVDVSDSSFQNIGRVGVLYFGDETNDSIAEGNVYVGKGDGDFLDYGFEVGAGAHVALWNNQVSDCRGIASQDGSQSAGLLATTFFGAGTVAVIESNTLTNNTSGLTVGTIGDSDTAQVQAAFNRWIDNAAGVTNYASVPIDAENNWWGCNAGPATDPCDPIVGTGAVDGDPHLVLSLTASPDSLALGETAVLTADLQHNSDLANVSGLGSIANNTTIAFDGGSLGSVSPTTDGTLSGVAGTVFTAETLGTNFVATTLDQQTVQVEITVVDDSGPELEIDEQIPAAAGETVVVPVQFRNNGADIATLAFALDFDEGCLAFDPTDSDFDGIPDAMNFLLPAGFSPLVYVDLGDTDREISVAVLQPSVPLAVLPSAILVDISFTTTCNPPLGAPILAPVTFSNAPAPSFGDTSGQSLLGSSLGGSVLIYGGLRGDCNGDGVVDAGDLAACSLEVFDGDGAFWLDTPGGTFGGNPVGCDSNADTVVDAGDLTCKSRLIFGLDCGSSAGSTGAGTTMPELQLPYEMTEASGLASVPLSLATDGHELSAVMLSIDIDTDRLRFDPADHDGDGLPDSVHLAQGMSMVSATYDASDRDGELDIVLARLGVNAAPFEDGALLHIEVEPLAPASTLDGSLRFAASPAASFGNALGNSVPGSTQLVVTPMFADGFESGDTTKWSITQP